MILTENFNLAEFKCNDGTEVPTELIPNAIKLAIELQKLRDSLHEPIHINSAYRTPVYNKKIGGKQLSQHLEAKAADITVKSKTPKQLAAHIEKMITAGTLNFGGIGLYPGFVHVDIRAGNARW